MLNFSYYIKKFFSKTDTMFCFVVYSEWMVVKNIMTTSTVWCPALNHAKVASLNPCLYTSNANVSTVKNQIMS